MGMTSKPHSRPLLKTAREEINDNHAREDAHHNEEICPACEALRELDALEEQLELITNANARSRAVAASWMESAGELQEQLETLRSAALAYLSVPSGPGDWSAEREEARRVLSAALNPARKPEGA